MAFGNNRQGQASYRERLASQNLDVTPAPSSSGGFGAGFLVLALALFVVSFGGMWAFHHLSTGASAKPDPSLQALLASEPTARARTYETHGAVPFALAGKTSVNITVNRTETGLDAIDSELHENCTRRISDTAAEWSVKRGVAIFRVPEGAEFLACSMRHQRSRFCKSAYRERLVSRIEEYLRAHKAREKLLARHSKMTERIVATQRSIDPGQNGDPRVLELVPDDLAKALESLSGTGLIGKSDFGGLFKTAPEVLLPYLSDVPRPC